MDVDGLTPTAEQIVWARKAFGNRPGLMVMIRPRSGDFCYSPKEIELMIQQIHMAGECGANGIVLGALRSGDKSIDTDQLLKLKEISDQYNLSVTFHRAFDATPDPCYSIQQLIERGIDRVLTSGTKWGEKGTALDGINKLKEIVQVSSGRIEIIIGGGISSNNVKSILTALPLSGNKISVHSYSGVQQNGAPKIETVKSLVDEVRRVELLD